MSKTHLRRGGGGNRQQQAVVLGCQGCSHGIVVVEEYRVVPGLMGARWVPMHWWPTPGVAVDLADVPSELAAAYEEGVRCVSVEAPHAAVAMFRNALAHIVHDKGSEEAKKKKTLNQSIQQMVADKTLFDAFDDWATHIREMGNAGAHQESWDEIPLSDAQDLQKLVLALIDNLYVRPAELARMKKPTKRSATP
ncbi:DUF4145 domain-containing protein [Nocardia cyriacigeorgica]|uniref:DUF4145 domain-containing protein n=1 Tax=Nocardia cyriacigeorgica TaxID=135487 RepID=UPI00148692FC|nr:DUF4145 domain-containing protein [Nocardia cyriacigeorgica]